MTEWVKFLMEKGICYPDSEGNMPCDNGAICDKCMSEPVTREYEVWVANKNKK